MMFKLKTVTAAILVAGISNISMGGNAPLPPAVYNGGPMSPLVNLTDIVVAERKGFAGIEAAMQITEAYVHSHGCLARNWDLEVAADSLSPPQAGANNPLANYVAFDGVNMLITAAMKIPGRGQSINVAGGGALSGKAVAGFNANYVYNEVNNMMTNVDMAMTIIGRNGRPDRFTGNVIKDFYMGTDRPGTPDAYDSFILYDWGLQAVLKANYPTEKWWQRSKTRRSDFYTGRTVFVKDRLVGNIPCRITAGLDGSNFVNLFWQEGTVRVDPFITPSTVSNSLDRVQNFGPDQDLPAPHEAP